MRVLVTGAGGFIGHHLVNYLKDRGDWVRGVDLVYPSYALTRADQFLQLDLRYLDSCIQAVMGDIDQVYHLAADMGGIGYITQHHAQITSNNLRIDTHMLHAALMLAQVDRFFYSSSACIYPQSKQLITDLAPLKEEDAYPADAEKGYGWEKLMTELLCEYYNEMGFKTRVARFHNVYGPLGTWTGGKEKAPAALCRKIALVQDGGEIEIWGDGLQTRSFMFIKDCVEGICKIMDSNISIPMNLGNDSLISIDSLAMMIASIANKKIRIRHNLNAPQGVRGRNSDNSLMWELFQWLPLTRLQDGLAPTYRWINDQVRRAAE